MKVVRVLGAVILAVLLTGRSGGKTDVAELRPIEVISVRMQDTTITIETDTEDGGQGRTVQDAFENLRETTAGEVFLETADYLLVESQALICLPELSEILRPNCRICICSDRIDLGAAGDYLRIHQPGITVREYMAGEEGIPILKCTEGKMTLVRK